MKVPRIPFRWNIRKLNEIGSLLQYAPEPHDYPPFQTELLRSLSRILAFAGNSHWYFIGRSPESYFDFLSGLFESDEEMLKRVHLLQFSAGRIVQDYAYIKQHHYEGLMNLRHYFQQQKLDPISIQNRKEQTALIDIVDGGSTFQLLIEILYDWTKELKGNWPMLREKIRLVGLTERTKNSPNTWRWQQKREWVAEFGIRQIKNVSLPAGMWTFIGNYQAKATQSFRPERWNAPEIIHPKHKGIHLKGLKRAVEVYEWGKSDEGRTQLRKHLTQEIEMRESWFRALVGSI